MKTYKLVSGIISIILGVIVDILSPVIDAANKFNNIDPQFINTGYFVGWMLIIGGIISIVTRDNSEKTGDAVLIFVFGFAALIALLCHGIFSKLAIWGLWCVINTILAIIDYYSAKK